VFFKILGTAAGGGFPQWNCACKGCVSARDNALLKRAHACAAVSATGDRWYLLNAPPDIASQIETSPALHPGPAVRETAIAGLILTDAELDHTIGMLVLREQSELQVYSTNTVRRALQTDFPVDSILNRYATLNWHTIKPNQPFTIDGERIRIHAFHCGRKRPRYVQDRANSEEEWVLGLRIENPATGKSILYAPAIESLSAELTEALESSQTAFLDGTFWTEDELSLNGISERRASECGHVPLHGDSGLIEYLSHPQRRRRTYLIHVNNTNPLLVPDPADITLPEWIGLATEGMVIEE
jgi:pyrroloquinoline quinone biosynthesis protein B